MNTARLVSAMVHLLLIVALFTLNVPVMPTMKAYAAAGVTDARFSRLTRGMNMMWLRDVPAYQFLFTAQDIALIKGAGFRHVRLSVGVNNLFNEHAPTQLNRSELVKVDYALDLIMNQGLAAIIEMHDADAVRMVNDQSYADKYATFWETLARHLNRRDPEYLFLEVLNEPMVPEATAWNAILPKFLAAMRRGAPHHTLIADINEFSTQRKHEVITALELTQPVADPNVVYNFHFYNPFMFTFQGVHWMGDEFQSLRNLPYPANLQLCASALPTIQNSTARSWAEGYCWEQMYREKLVPYFQRVGAWIQKYNARVTMNEFGVWKPHVPNDSRLRYITDIRTLAETYNIGWGIWDYSEDFGTVVWINGVKQIAPDTLVALGMTPVTPPAGQREGSSTAIYAGQLAQGWEDWSWDSTNNPANANPTQSGASAFSVAYTKPWAGLWLRHREYAVAPLATTLEFSIHGGTTGNQKLWIYAQDTTIAGFYPKLDLQRYIEGGSVAANQWRTVKIPLSDLGIQTNPVKSFVLQDASGNVQGVFYLDAIRLVQYSNPSGVLPPLLAHKVTIPFMRAGFRSNW